MVAQAVRLPKTSGQGTFFFLVLKDAYPINVLNQLKSCQGVPGLRHGRNCNLHQGRGIMGVYRRFPSEGR